MTTAITECWIGRITTTSMRDAERERDQQRQEEREPVRDAPDRELIRDVRRRHRELALGEVDHFRRAVDQDEREREAAEDRALRETGDRLLREDRARQAADHEEDRARDEQQQHGHRDAGADSRLSLRETEHQ